MKKSSRKLNEFSPKTRELFKYIFQCSFCGKNTNDCLHHIVGRGKTDSALENSPLNAAPICNQSCHLKHHGLLSTMKYQKKLLNRTYDFLCASGYTFTNKDIRFIKKYSELYM